MQTNSILYFVMLKVQPRVGPRFDGTQLSVNLWASPCYSLASKEPGLHLITTLQQTKMYQALLIGELYFTLLRSLPHRVKM